MISKQMWLNVFFVICKIVILILCSNPSVAIFHYEKF